MEKMFIGKAYKELSISEDKRWLLLTTITGEVECYLAEGDCCSNSWIEHISGVEALTSGCEIFEEEHVDIETSWADESEEEYIRVSAIKLKTVQGYVDIEYRNLSNGYYSGWIERSEKMPNKNLKVVFKKVTGDF